MYTETRPWGKFTNLYEDDFCKVKKIEILPGQAPSYQYHYKRDETWTIIQGSGILRLNDIEFNITSGKTYTIPRMCRHQIKNNSYMPLIFIEIQTGEYFGEDDIVRLEDNYGRV